MKWMNERKGGIDGWKGRGNGWMEWMNGWMDEWMDRRGEGMDGWKVGWERCLRDKMECMKI